MTTKTIRLLTALFAAQVALAVGLTFTGHSLSAAQDNKPLLALTAGTVDHVTIDGPDKAHVVLTKVDGHWQLPDVGGFPADAARVKRLLDQIVALKPGEPVATTSSARTRFKVGEKTFERRVVLAAGDKALGTLYLGTSPAMRQVHARVNGQDDIYAVKLETYAVPVKAKAWEDHAILQIPQHDIAGIDVDGLQLRRVQASGEANIKPAPVAAPASAPQAASPATASAAKPAAAAATWQSQQLSAGEHLDTGAVAKLASQLANLRIENVLGKTAKPDYGLGKPELQLTVTRKDGKTVEYQLGKMSAGDDYALKSSARAEYFELPAYMAQQLINDSKRATLAPETSVASADTSAAKKHALHKSQKKH